MTADRLSAAGAGGGTPQGAASSRAKFPALGLHRSLRALACFVASLAHATPCRGSRTSAAINRAEQRQQSRSLIRRLKNRLFGPLVDTGTAEICFPVLGVFCRVQESKSQPQLQRKNPHGLPPALLASWCLCALALAHVPLNAHAAKASNWGTVGIGSTGNARTINAPGMASNSGGSTIPISPTVGGWTQAGNYGVPPGAVGPTMVLGGAGHVFFKGTKYPFQVGYQSPWAALAPAALGALCLGSGPVGVATCVGGAAAAPFVYQWLTNAGGRISPTTGELERIPKEFCYTAPCYEYTVAGNPSKHPSAIAACSNFAANFPDPSRTATVINADGGFCRMEVVITATGVSQGTDARQINQTSIPPKSPTWYPSSMDDIVPYMRDTPVPDGRVVGDILSRGGEIPLPTPTVTGPTKITGPESSTNNPDGSRTVQKTEHNFQVDGNKITNISNVTTTTTYNTDNSVRNATTTTTTPTPEQAAPEETDYCEKRPNAVGCAELDTPEGKVPRETKTITYAEESVLGAGSCPADVNWSSGTTGRSYKFIDWSSACGWAGSISWLVIVLATYAAFWIVIPGNTQVKPS